MTKTILGIDIGGSGVKLAQVSGGEVRKAAAAALPDNLIQGSRILSVDALADELRRIVRQEGMRTRDCALVLPPDTAFVRKAVMPYMTAENLKINLPYEFHDYIQNDKSLYFYDYAVVDVRTDEDGTPEELELLTAAVARETIALYRTMLRKAGLRLTIALPEYLTYRNIIRGYEEREPDHPAEYCIADLGHGAIRVHMYRGPVYETTRVIEYGGSSLDQLIADVLSVDPHTAATYKAANFNGVQELPACRDLYSHIALEIMRAVNFYGFNTPDSDLRDIYLSGGLARVAPLMEEIRNTLELNCHTVEELLPDGADEELALLCTAAVGATLQTNGR